MDLTTINFAEIINYVSLAVTAAAAAAAVFPQGEPGTIWFNIRKVIDFLALNIGNAKNLMKK